jgi:hypothetical protein
MSPELGEAVIFAAGATAFTVIVVVFELVPPAPVTVNVAVYVPAAAYVCDGLCDVLVPPSPKFHAYDEIVPVDVLTN